MIWVLDHLGDLESDLSRFHRIDDLEQLDGPKFFRLIWRVSTYGGVMGMRLEEERRSLGPVPTATAPASPVAASTGGSGPKPLAAFMAENPDVFDKRRVAG